MLHNLNSNINIEPKKVSKIARSYERFVKKEGDLNTIFINSTKDFDQLKCFLLSFSGDLKIVDKNIILTNGRFSHICQSKQVFQKLTWVKIAKFVGEVRNCHVFDSYVCHSFQRMQSHLKHCMKKKNI